MFLKLASAAANKGKMTNLAEIITLFALILQFVQGKKKKKNKLKRQLELETKNVIHGIVH